MEEGGARCDLVGLRRAPRWKDPGALGTSNECVIAVVFVFPESSRNAKKEA